MSTWKITMLSQPAHELALPMSSLLTSLPRAQGEWWLCDNYALGHKTGWTLMYGKPTNQKIRFEFRLYHVLTKWHLKFMKFETQCSSFVEWELLIPTPPHCLWYALSVHYVMGLSPFPPNKCYCVWSYNRRKNPLNLLNTCKEICDPKIYIRFHIYEKKNVIRYSYIM